MAKNPDISKFDEFIQSSVEGAKVPAPEGVWEGISSGIGSGAGAASQAGMLAKIGGIKSVIIGGAAVVAIVATAVLTNNSQDKPAQDSVQQEQPATTTENAVVENEQTTRGSVETTTATTSNPQAGQTTSGTTSGNTGNTTSGNSNNQDGISGTDNPVQDQRSGDEDAGGENVQAPLTFDLTESWICANGTCEAKLGANPNGVDYYWVVDGVKFPPRKNLKISGLEAGSVNVSLISFPNGKKATNVKTLKVEDSKPKVLANKIQRGYYSFGTETEHKSYEWNFVQSNHMSTSPAPKQYFDYLQLATCKVILWTVNDKGCRDSAHATISFVEAPKITNTFTPYEKDGINDEFEIPIEHETYYRLIVFNARGERVFESSHKENTWDGTDINTGKMAAPGGYTYKFVYQQVGKARKVKQGTLYLLK